MEMKFSSRLSNVVFARGAVASFLLERDLELGVINEIKTITSEAVTNAIVHGYLLDPERLVYLSLSLEGDRLVIEVRDDGVGIADITKAREPLYTTKVEEERAGLGFTIMDIFSDYIEVTSSINSGTKIICYKTI